MPRRILLLITDLEIGGTPTVVRELAIRLRDQDTQVEVACLSEWGPVADQLRDAGVFVTALRASRQSQIMGASARLIRLIRDRKYDTVLSFLVHANTIAAIVSRFCADVRFMQSIQTTQPNPKWHWLMQSIAQRKAERVIVPTVSAARAAIDLADVSLEKIVVIPNAIDPENFPPSLVALNAPSPYPIGFIGRLHAVKRVPILLDAVAHLRSAVHLHIFGDGAERNRIASRLTELDLSRAVTMHGTISRPQDALMQIGLLVLPSLAEGFGLVLIEAMAAGVPVVAMNVPGIRDVVRDEITGLLARSEDLVTQIERVVSNRRLRERLIKNGLKEVREKYSWRGVIQRYRDVLQCR